MSRLKPYPTYKESGIGWLGKVPDSWQLKRLWTLFDREKNVGFPEEQMLSVFRDYGVVPKESRENNNKTAENRNIYQLVEPGWLVSNRMKAWQGSVGISSYRGIVSGHYICFRPAHAEDDSYLNWLFRSLPYAAGYRSISRGVRIGQAEIDNDEYRLLPVLVPPIDEQRQIAAYLDGETSAIDAFIADQEELIGLLNERRSATITQAVTKGLDTNAPMKDSGIPWLGAIPATWAALRMRYLAKVETGSSDTADAEEDGEYPFFIRSQTIERINKFSYDTEAVLTAGDGAGVGKVYHHFRGKFEAHQRVYVMHDFQKVTGRFFYYYLSLMFGPVVLAGTAKSTVDSLRRPMFADFCITVPSKSEQYQITSYLDKEIAEIDATIEDAQHSIALSKERRAAVISAAVTGKIDVRQAAVTVQAIIQGEPVGVA
jgi:type I restriction enzyme, S subunit